MEMGMTTKGMARVRISFNPSEKKEVDGLKLKGSKFIDEVEQIDEGSVPETGKSDTPHQIEEAQKAAEYHAGEIRRLKSLAQTKIEEATMWAVKAATYFGHEAKKSDDG